MAVMVLPRLIHRPGAKVKEVSVFLTAVLSVVALKVDAQPGVNVWPIELEELVVLFRPSECIEVVELAPLFQQTEQEPTATHKMGTMTAQTQHESNETKIENKNESLNQLLANNKEKTPMCLVNELARFNEIQHQYRLTDEQGPAHRKQFTVTLSLGTEEYSAEGASIKKAQHQAASYALLKTKYNHPPPKPLRSIRKNNITPTVELNAWAMKRGEQATYHFLPPSNPALTVASGMGSGYMPPPPPPPPGPHPPPYNHFNGYRNAYQMPYEYQRRSIARHYAYYDKLRRYGDGGRIPTSLSLPPMAPLFSVMVKVGSREFIGEGPTAQVARHAAASKALSEIRTLPLPDDKADRVAESNATDGKDENGTDAKSPISLVHEVALRHKFPVSFEVVNMTGPPHMRSFRTVCIVGEWKTEGVGNSKKISKKRASESMLEQLKSLTPDAVTVLNPSPRLKKKTARKKKPKNLIKEPKQVVATENSTPSVDKDEINPISRLIHIQIAKKEPEPVYTLVDESGAPRNREFIMSVEVGDLKARGAGPNKRIAKRAAAEAMLQTLGYSRSARTEQGAPERAPRKVPETTSVGGTSGRQLVPGLILMSDSYKVATPKNTDVPKPQKQQGGNTTFRSKDQLLYLAELLHFKVQFDDFPKGNHQEYLSLVSLSTDPPMVCHGAGVTTEASHDQAALTALRTLSEMGLDSVFQPNLTKNETAGSGGDGVQVPPSFLKGGVIFEDSPKHS